ncbi:MAG: hypothetical protein ACYDIA_13825 [Candidatus Humimicrobiaceae bacterium]
MNSIKKILISYASVFDNCISPKDFNDIVKDIEKLYKNAEFPFSKEDMKRLEEYNKMNEKEADI